MKRLLIITLVTVALGLIAYAFIWVDNERVAQDVSDFSPNKKTPIEKTATGDTNTGEVLSGDIATGDALETPAADETTPTADAPVSETTDEQAAQ